MRTGWIPEHQVVDGAVLDDGTGNNDSNSEEDMQGGEKGAGKGKGTQAGKQKGKVTEDRKGKGKGKGKAMEEEKGKGNGNGKGNGMTKQTRGGDDISCAVALQFQTELYEVDSDTED